MNEEAPLSKARTGTFLNEYTEIVKIAGFKVFEIMLKSTIIPVLCSNLIRYSVYTRKYL